MWLLTTARAELVWFVRPPEKYAILSHVWETEEQSFQEVQAIAQACVVSGENPRDFVSPKILNCCVWAESHGFAYVWTDTCCIDKTSSAELSEAINSMFVWYAAAAVCYAFLADVSDGEPPAAPGSAFRASRWFTRGWTLQELIAPKVVIFLSQTWVPIASKRASAALLEEITGIDAPVLIGTLALHEVSVARRMSWASARHTSRIEDEAYCLMGIFGVHLPTIYGEGKEAFIRLQEEIMRRIPDTTLLAWGPRADPVETLLGYRSVFPTSNGTAYIERSCLLAPSPAAFRDCSDLVSVSKKVLAAAFDIDPHTLSFMVTSNGIQALCPVVHFSGVALLLLPCCKAQDDYSTFVALILRFQGEGSPWAVGTRTLTESVTIEHRDARNSASLIEQLLARQPSVITRRNHCDVRCVLLPIGFDFTTCLQRPLKQRYHHLAPKWERSYIAYRREQVLCQDPRPNGALGMQRKASMSPYYKLFFPSWVTTRLQLSGFSVPVLAEDPAPGFHAGERLTIPVLDWRHREQLRLELRTDVQLHSIPGSDAPIMAALWCAILLPSDTNISLDAQMSALHDGWGSEHGSTRASNTRESSVDERDESVADSGSTSDVDEDDSDIEVEAGFVDLWEHSGVKGCKEFFSGRWRMLLTFTRLCDAPSEDEMNVSNVYLVDLDLSYMDV